MLRHPARVPLLAAVAALLLGGCERDGAAASDPPLPSVAAVARTPASDVLRGWDEARAAAFAQADVAALRRLYAAGSSAGTSDVRLLRAYTRRGLRVQGMRMQLLAVETVRRDRRLLRLRVTDRMVGAVAVAVGNGSGRRLRLPRDAATTRVLELARRGPGGPWKVVWVRE